MAAVTILEGSSLVEMLIYGFISANMLLSGTYMVQRGFKKLAARGE